MPMTHYSNWSKDEWKNLLINNPGQSVLDNEQNIIVDEDIENMGFSPFLARTPNEVVGIMHELNTEMYGHIVRSKGYFKGQNEYFRYDYVDGTYLIGQCPDMPDTRAVVIGKNLNGEKLKQLFLNPGFAKNTNWNE